MENTLKLHSILSIHPLTRAGTGWTFEYWAHMYMGTGKPLLAIEHNECKEMQPVSRKPVTSTVTVLATSPNTSFYWCPLVTNFSGMDSILVNAAKRHVYLLQMTIAHKHCSPKDGVHRIWKTVGLRFGFWHVVFMTDNEELAKKYVDAFPAIPLGRGAKKQMVEAWGCVLPTEA